MSRLDLLRAKERRRQEEQIPLIKSAVKEVVESDSFNLSLIHHNEQFAGDDVTSKQEAAEKIASAVASAVTDPVKRFEAACAARGLEERHINRVINNMCNTFCLTDSADMEEKKEAVAIYFSEHPYAYDDIKVMI